MENLLNRLRTGFLRVDSHHAQTEKHSTESNNGLCNCSNMPFTISEHGLLLLMQNFNATLKGDTWMMGRTSGRNSQRN